MQTLSSAGKLIEIIKAKMKEHNIDSVELSFMVFKGNTIQFYSAFECFCSFILNICTKCMKYFSPSSYSLPPHKSAPIEF